MPSKFALPGMPRQVVSAAPGYTLLLYHDAEQSIREHVVVGWQVFDGFGVLPLIVLRLPGEMGVQLPDGRVINPAGDLLGSREDWLAEQRGERWKGWLRYTPAKEVVTA